MDLSFRFGSGPIAVILIHGLTGTPVEMRSLGKSIALNGHSVYGVQLAGHCGTEDDLIATNHIDWQKTVEDLIDNIKSTHEHIVLGGLSMGALLALKIAAERQDIKGVLCYSTTLFYDGWTISKNRWMLSLGLALGLGHWWRFKEVHPFGLKDDRIRERILAAARAHESKLASELATPGKSIRDLNRLIKITKSKLGDVRCPSLIMHAREDDVTSLKNADFLAARLRGHVVKIILDDSYHIITLDRERDKVGTHTNIFLQNYI